MTKLLASGTVNSIFPAPVQADSWADLCDWMRNDMAEFKEKFGFSVSCDVINSYSESGEYIPASILGKSEGDFNSCRGKSSESFSGDGFIITVYERFTLGIITTIKGKTVAGFRESLVKVAAKGTLVVSFKYYPHGTNGWAETVKTFRIVL